MNWEKELIHIGNVKVGSKTKFHFTSTKELEIKTITPGCGGCTKIEGYKNNNLNVVFKADAIPYHLNKSIIVIRKIITVTYADDTKEVLTFTATVMK